VLLASLSQLNLILSYTPKKLKLVTVLELENVFVADPAPSMVISKKSDEPGLVAIVPCTLRLPEKLVV